MGRAARAVIFMSLSSSRNSTPLNCRWVINLPIFDPLMKLSFNLNILDNIVFSILKYIIQLFLLLGLKILITAQATWRFEHWTNQTHYLCKPFSSTYISLPTVTYSLFKSFKIVDYPSVIYVLASSYYDFLITV